MALHTKLVVVAVCLAAMALASAGGMACRAVRRGRETAPPAGHGGPALPEPAGRHSTPPAHAGGHGHDGTGGGLPPPAPAAAPLPAPVDGRARDAVDLDDGASGEVMDEKFTPKGAVNLAYNIGRGSYTGFQNQLHQVLSTNRLVEGIPVMAPQSPGASPTWILIQLLGSNMKEKITLAVRNDNAYIAGFNSGGWFAFPLYQRQIDGSTALPKREDYPSLIGGSNNLVDLDVNRDAALEAVRFLSTYRTSDDEQQEHQARLAVEDAKSVVLWGEVSRALVGFNKTGKWIDGKTALENFKAAGIGSPPQEAIDAVRLLVRPKDFKVDQA